MGRESFCTMCGMCCWDWKGNNPQDKCERLAEDMKTCLIYGKRAEFGRPECDIPMQLHQACDLPETCGYVIKWRKEGLI